MKFTSSVVFISLISCAFACTNPKIKSSSYSTSNNRISDETVFLWKFSVSCSSGAASDLQVLIGKEIVPVTSSPESNQFQVSWVVPNSKASSGSYAVKLYDEAGANSLRKAMRNGEESSVPSIGELNLSHKGSSGKMWVTTEFMAVIAMSVVFYGVCKQRNDVLS